MLLEFYAGLLTGFLIAMFLVASGSGVVIVQEKSMTVHYKKEAYRLIKIPEE